MARSLGALVPFIIAPLATAVLACTSNGDSQRGTQPTEQRFGNVTVVYQPQVPCQSAGSPFASRCSRMSGVFVGVNDQTEVSMLARPDGSFIAASVNAPSSQFYGRVRVRVADPWVCPPVQTCVAYTGSGISVNGVRLADGDEETTFSFYPPDVVSR